MRMTVIPVGHGARSVMRTEDKNESDAPIIYERRTSVSEPKPTSAMRTGHRHVPLPQTYDKTQGQRAHTHTVASICWYSYIVRLQGGQYSLERTENKTKVMRWHQGKSILISTSCKRTLEKVGRLLVVQYLRRVTL
jgi:hypothetical protein